MTSTKAVNYQVISQTLCALGKLFEGGDDVSEFRYLGCCFNLLEPDVFITADHCIAGVALDKVKVNHFAGIGKYLLSGVRNVDVVSECDIAVLRIDKWEPMWAEPFHRLKYGADLGEEACALGYPEDRFSADASKPTLRIFRGNIQRPFGYERAGHAPYSAYELSFPCPPGLSGGPVFSAHAPFPVMGVVTANLKTYSVVEAEQEVISPGHHKETQYRQVITYGVAANIVGAVDALESVVGRNLRNPER